MKTFIANDHGGYKLKLCVFQYLKENGYEFEDMGTDSEKIVRYPHYAQKVSHAVLEEKTGVVF